MTAGIHTPALAVWLLSCLVVITMLRNPLAAVPVILAAAAVARTGRATSLFRGFVLVGLIALALRTVLFGLTGHSGEAVLFALPALRLPILLGGATLGGSVTAEAIAQAISEGLRFVAILACFGAFLAVADTIDLVRMVPRFLFEAGLVVNIALAYAPQLARGVRAIREAQRMRGAGRGPRSPAAIFTPVLATALERSIALAESMDARGYGRTRGRSRAEGQWRTAAAGAALAAAAGSVLWAGGKAPAATAPAALAAAAALAWSLHRLSRLVPRTRYRLRKWGARDRAVAAGAIAAALLAVALSTRGISAGRFDPYTELMPRAPDPASTLVAASLALPVLLRRRDSRDLAAGVEISVRRAGGAG